MGQPVLLRPFEPEQFTSLRYGEHLADLGALPSIGSVGDAYDNALAESVNGAYKCELIRGPGRSPWRTVEDVELATLPWVHWYNTARLHEYLDYVPPAEFEDRWRGNLPLYGPESPANDPGGRKGAGEIELIGAQ